MTTKKARAQKMGLITAAALAFLGLSSFIGRIDTAACRLAASLGISPGTMAETVPSILMGAWHILRPCALGHLRLLEAVLQISASCWQFVLTLTLVA